MTSPSSHQPASAVDVRALSKLHGSTAALLDVTFSVAPGDLIAILGASGSGKTTLLKLLAGHVTPTGGRIRVSGLDLRTARLALTARTGYVSQIRRDFGHMVSRDLLEFSARARQIPERQVNSRIEHVVAVCELDGELDMPCRRLSVDGRTRVALAQALLHEPSVLLLDEILSGLDDRETQQTTRVLSRLRGGTTLLVTGPLTAGTLLAADRALVLEGGRLAFDGRPADMWQAGKPF